MNLIEYNNQTFYIDLDKLMEWVCCTSPKQRNIETTVTQIYPMDSGNGDNDKDMQKEITETKNSLNETLNSFKYDLIRNLINVIITPITDGEYIEEEITTIGQTLAFNTLLHCGIIVEITE